MARQVSRQATTSSCCRSWFSARLMTSPRLSLLSVVFSGYARKCITLLVKDHWLVTLRCAFDRSLRSIGVAERRSRRAPGAFLDALRFFAIYPSYDTRTILVCSSLLLNLNCLPTILPCSPPSPTHLHFFASVCITSLLCFCLLHTKSSSVGVWVHGNVALLLFSMCSSSCQGWMRRCRRDNGHYAELCTSVGD
jgi:hypothetical protein